MMGPAREAAGLLLLLLCAAAAAAPTPFRRLEGGVDGADGGAGAVGAAAAPSPGPSPAELHPLEKQLVEAGEPPAPAPAPVHHPPTHSVAPSGPAVAAAAAAEERVRRGIVYDRWPFRLDIDTEYQDWILVAVCMLLVALWSLPCLCGRNHNGCSRSFSSFVYTRLHIFFCIITYVNLLILMFTIGVLPDWTVNEFMEWLVYFIVWVLVHLQQMITSVAILFGFFLLIRFRERIALAAGVEHMTVFRFDWREVLGFSTKKRPIEFFIWKLDGLKSSYGKVLKANDVYVECHMGHNEPMRTRVHNNAGSACIVRESFQLNIDESSPSTLMTLLVKDQALLGGSELARLMLSTREICGIEDQTGRRRAAFTYSNEYFVPLNLSPAGNIWIAIAPVEDGDLHHEERAPLMEDEDTLVTC